MNGAGNLSARIVEALKDHRCTHQAMPRRRAETTADDPTKADSPPTGQRLVSWMQLSRPRVANHVHPKLKIK